MDTAVDKNSLFSSIPMASFIFSDQLNITEANYSCLEYHGVDNKEDLKRYIEKAGDLQKLCNKVKEGLKGISDCIEYSFWNPKDNRYHYSEAFVLPVRNSTNTVIGVAITEKDKTLHHTMLNELQEIKQNITQ